MLSRCSKQNGQYAVLDISKYQAKDVTNEVKRCLKGELTGSYHHNVKNVVIILGDKVGYITRNEVVQGKFDKLMETLK